MAATGCGAASIPKNKQGRAGARPCCLCFAIPAAGPWSLAADHGALQEPASCTPRVMSQLNYRRRVLRRVAFLRVAFLRAVFRLAFLRVAFLRVAFLRVAFLRVAFLRAFFLAAMRSVLVSVSEMMPVTSGRACGLRRLRTVNR